MLVSGSELSGQRRRQGAKMMARALGDMRFTSSSRATLRGKWQLEVAREPRDWRPGPWGCRRRESARRTLEAEASTPLPPWQPGSSGATAGPGNAGVGLLTGTPHPAEHGWQALA